MRFYLILFAFILVGVSAKNLKRSQRDLSQSLSAMQKQLSDMVRRISPLPSRPINPSGVGNIPFNREVEKETGIDQTEALIPTIIIDEPFEDPIDTIEEPVDEFEVVEPQNPDLFTTFFNVFNSNRQPWYNGPNTCLTIENIDETDHVNDTASLKEINFSVSGAFSSSAGVYSKSCVQNDEEFVCQIQDITDGVKRTRIKRRRCCYGYKRDLATDGYCKEIDLKDLVQTLKEVGCESFYNMSVNAGLEPLLRNQNLTVFCPNDEAMETLEEETNNIEINEVPLARKRRQIKGGLAYNLENHIVPGFIRSSDFVDENVLMTVNKETSLRTNIYRVPQTVLTVNCARITSNNKYATNGIVHLVDRIIKPAIDTVADIITKKSDFTILKKLISISGLLPKLRDRSSHLTVFAPTDSAFSKSGIDIDYLQSSGCLDKLLNNHILPNVICSTAINGRVQSQNLLGSNLKLHRDPADQKLYIGENVQITARDLVGTNGVVHVIDNLAIPPEAQKPLEALNKVGYSSLIVALNKTSVIATLEKDSNFSFIVPNKESFRNLPDEVTENNEKLKDLLLYHAIEPSTDLLSLKNNAFVTAKNGKKIRINRYRLGFHPTVTAQCVPMPRKKLGICDGSLQFLNGVMKPAEGKLMFALSDKKEYSIVKKIVDAANLSNALNTDGPYTMLVPTDKVIRESLSEQAIGTLINSGEAALNFISKYIFPEMLCCSGIKDDLHGFFHNSLTTIDNHRHPITRDYINNIPKISGSRLINCDNVVENGVIHEIDRLFVKRKRQFPCFFGCTLSIL